MFVSFADYHHRHHRSHPDRMLNCAVPWFAMCFCYVWMLIRFLHSKLTTHIVRPLSLVTLCVCIFVCRSPLVHQIDAPESKYFVVVVFLVAMFTEIYCDRSHSNVHRFALIHTELKAKYALYTRVIVGRGGARGNRIGMHKRKWIGTREVHQRHTGEIKWIPIFYYVNTSA